MTGVTHALLGACRDGDAVRVAELLAAGHSPDQPLDAVGTTPLMAASSLAVLDVLLEAGANPSATRFGQDALQIVVSDEQSALEVGDRLAGAGRLIARGARLDHRNQHGWSRLYLAAFAGDAGAVAALLALGAEPDDEPPPLGAACWGSGDERTHHIIQLLVGAGADVHRRDGAGWTLLHAAAMPYSHGSGFASSDGANPPALQALISCGLDPDVSGPGGVTALILAAGDGAVAAVDVLLAAGSDREWRDVDGRRAIDYARDSQQRLTELLATASAETAGAVRAARDRARLCVARLSR